MNRATRLLLVTFLAPWLLGCDDALEVTSIVRKTVSTVNSPGTTTASGSLQPGPSGALGAGGVVVVARGVHGTVLGLDGQPARDVAVKGLISNNSAGLIGNNSAGLIGNNSAGYRVAALETRTDNEGRYSLDVLEGDKLNVEAVLSEDVKALQLDAGAGVDTDLRLAYTGRIKGRVTPPQANITDLLGVDVFVPGTSYMAKTDAAGHFELAAVPVGTFSIVANHVDLGRAVKERVVVQSKQLTDTGSLALSTVLPELTALSPTNGAPGQTITLTGSAFGVTAGKKPEVLINGLQAQVTSASNTELKFTLPTGALSGDVRVRVAGLESATRSFQVLSSLAVFPDTMATQAASKDAVPPTRDVLAMGVTRSYLVRALDTAGQLVSNPNVTWSQVTGSATLAAGTLTPVAPGTLTLTVFAGTLAPPPPLEIEIIPAIAALRLGPASLPTLNPRPLNVTLTPGELAALIDRVQLSAWAEHSDGSTRSVPVTWSSNDARLTVSAAGLATATPGAAEGPVTVTVTTTADPGKSAQVPLQLLHLGGLSFEID